MPAPLGNTHSADGKRYRKALERALAHEGGSVEDGLFKIAKARVAKAIEGDNEAIRDIGDRLDGKPTQGVEVGGFNGDPIQSKLTVEFIGAGVPAGSVRLPVASDS